MHFFDKFWLRTIIILKAHLPKKTPKGNHHFNLLLILDRDNNSWLGVTFVIFVYSVIHFTPEWMTFQNHRFIDLNELGPSVSMSADELSFLKYFPLFICSTGFVSGSADDNVFTDSTALYPADNLSSFVLKYSFKILNVYVYHLSATASWFFFNIFFNTFGSSRYMFLWVM